MPVIEIKGMPPTVSQASLAFLRNTLQGTVAEVLAIEPNQVSVFFSADLLTAGLGEELIVFIDNLFESPERTDVLRQRLAYEIADTIRAFILSTDELSHCCFVEVTVHRMDQHRDGFSCFRLDQDYETHAEGVLCPKGAHKAQERRDLAGQLNGVVIRYGVREWEFQCKCPQGLGVDIDCPLHRSDEFSDPASEVQLAFQYIQRVE